jgi:hypothetical protein
MPSVMRTRAENRQDFSHRVSRWEKSLGRSAASREGSLEAEIGVLVLSQRTEVVVAFEEVDFWKTGAQHSRGRVYLL